MFVEAKVKKLFEKMKDNYRRCLRKREKSTRSGAGTKKLPTYDFFSELSFLSDVMSSRPTESNLFTPPPSPAITPATSDVMVIILILIIFHQPLPQKIHVSLPPTETKKQVLKKGRVMILMKC